MIEINLLPEELRKKESVTVKLPDIPTLKIFAVTLAGLAVLQILITLFAFVQKFELYSLRGRLVTMTEANKDITRVKNETRALQARIHQIQALTTRPLYWSSFLSGLTASMTKGVWLRDLSVIEMDGAAASVRIKNLQLSGEPEAKVKLLRLEGGAIGKGQETAHIGKFLKSLKESPVLAPHFSQMELTNISQRKANDHDVYDFEILCVFKEGAV
jgi:Tfp pilus assembly protein PilN